jgi:glutamate/tyrosine decarboxylase-like PLP-dependent enzyme
MVCLGEEGYLDAARRIMDTADQIRAGVRSIPELKIFGRNSTFLVSIGSDVVDPYFVQDHLEKKGWRMNGCQDPAGFHFCITLRQTQPGIAERYVQDLRDAVEFAKHPTYEVPRTGFLYGMGSSADGREMMRIGMKGWLDASYETE